MNNLIVVEVLGGFVQNVIVSDDLDVEVWICDWDNLEEAGIRCPFCKETYLYVDASVKNGFICNGCNQSFLFIGKDDPDSSESSL